MSAYRTPEEDQASRAQQDRIRAVLDQAVQHGAHLLAAMNLGEPQAVVELWTNRLWNGLRSGLDDRPAARSGFADAGEDRLAAIVQLLKVRMVDESVAILRGIGVDR